MATVYEKLGHTFRLDRERPHALSGFQARLAAKIALHNFCLGLNEQLGRPRLAFAELVAWEPQGISHQAFNANSNEDTNPCNTKRSASAFCIPLICLHLGVWKDDQGFLLPAKARETLAGWSSDDDIDTRDVGFPYQSLRMLDCTDIPAEGTGEKEKNMEQIDVSMVCQKMRRNCLRPLSNFCVSADRSIGNRQRLR